MRNRWWLSGVFLMAGCAQSVDAPAVQQPEAEGPDADVSDAAVDADVTVDGAPIDEVPDAQFVDAHIYYDAFIPPDYTVDAAFVDESAVCAEAELPARIGACVLGPDGEPPDGTFQAEVIAGEALMGYCEGRVIGPPDLAHTTWIRAQAENGDWTIGIELNGPLDLPVGTGIEIELTTTPPQGDHGRTGTRLVIRSAAGMEASVMMGDRRFPNTVDDLRLEPGDEVCSVNTGPCLVTRLRLEASFTDAGVSIEPGAAADVGPYTVVHSGLDEIVGRDACHGGPQSFLIGARRR